MDAYEIERIWSLGVEFLELNGWRILGFIALAYVIWQKYSAYATRAHIQRTLAVANDPQRVAVLRREAARVREEQQLRLLETLPRKGNAKTSTGNSVHELKKQT